MTTRQDVQSATLDALAALLAADRGDIDGVNAMLTSYRPDTASVELALFIHSLIDLALVAVRVSACSSGITPETLLAATAAKVRGNITNEV